MNIEQEREAFEAWLPKAYRQPQESYSVHNMEVAFAAGYQAGRAVMQPRPEVEGVTLDGCLETLFRVGEYLGIDYVAARKAPRAPSDVYIKAIEDRTAMQSQNREDAAEWLKEHIRLAVEVAYGAPCTACSDDWHGENKAHSDSLARLIDHARRIEGDGK